MRKFKHYDVNQPMLLAPDIKDWLPDRHLARYLGDVVESLDLTEIFESYATKGGVGAPPLNPKLLLKVILYGYCAGIRSSRKLEKACQEIIPFRVLSCDQMPDHDTINEFRRKHLGRLHGLFLQVLTLCQKSGLVKLAHVSLDGTKVKANAKKSKSRKYGDLLKSREELAEEIRRMFEEAEAIDEEEDRLYGKGNRGDELPPELADKKKRLELIQKLIKEVESEAKGRKQELVKEKETKKKEDKAWMDETGFKFERRSPTIPKSDNPGDIILARRNPTDYESRIMKESQTGGYIQAYNAQIMVDASSQVIVAADVFNKPSDKQLLRPMIEEMKKNTNGNVPDFLTADNGYFSERDIVYVEREGIDPYIPPTKDAKGKRTILVGSKKTTITEFMREKLESKTGRSLYKLRKTLPEPVFGQIKSARGFREFLLRGLDKVKGEWQLVVIAHNLCKLHVAACI